MMSFEMNDRKKIGLGLTGFGVFFSFLGIIFFFDKGLIAMGNILFISGVTLTIGLKSSMQFFMKRSNFKGTISFGIGFFLVVIGWPIMGMIIEAYGFVVLFRFLFPVCSDKIVYSTMVHCLLGSNEAFSVQWLLADTGCFPSKDTHSWLAIPAAFCSIIL